MTKYEYNYPSHKSWRKKISEVTPDRWIELLFAGAVVSFAFLAWRNSKSTSTQTDQLISAANINACAAKQIAAASKRNATAAEGFATTAGLINGGIDTAVKRLGAQANATQSAAESAKQQLTAFKDAQKAQLVIDKVERVFAKPSGGGYDIRITVHVINAGPTAASQITIFPIRIDHATAKPDPRGQGLAPGAPLTLEATDHGSLESISTPDGYMVKSYVTIIYSDIFDRTQLTSNCFVYRDWKVDPKFRWIPCHLDPQEEVKHTKKTN